MKLAMKNLRIYLFVCLLVSILAPVAMADDQIRIEPNAKIIINEKGNDGHDEFCKDFSLTIAQAKKFFKRSKIISPRELHTEYDWLPCYVRGEILTGKDEYKWEIRAGGTGQINYENGKILYLGCKECEEGFK